MDFGPNRIEYVKALSDVLNLVEDSIVNDLITSVINHRYFEDHSNIIEKLKTIEAKKLYILTELTHKREGCRIIIKMLELKHQSDAAVKLRGYNTNLAIDLLQEPSDKIDLTVLKTAIPTDDTVGYKLMRNPRGKFIIIDNVKTLLEKKDHTLSFIESQRFKYIFDELYFDAEIWQDLTAIQIKEKLENVVISPNDQAFGLMIITHGGDDNVYGYNACEEIEKPGITDMDIVKADQMRISEVVQIFSKQKIFEKIPRIFIFDCCRDKNPLTSNEIKVFKDQLKNIETAVYSQNLTKKEKDYKFDEEFTVLMEKHGKHWVNKNEHVFIIYSCSEGYKSWLYESSISAFGHAFSHALARYACEKSLQHILARTCSLMDQFKIKDLHSAPEFRLQCAKRVLKFNAGAGKKDKKDKMRQNNP